MAAVQSKKKEKPQKLSLDAQYAQRCAEGPAALLRADGVEGAKLSRYAFDASHQPHGPFEVTSPAALAVLVSDHLDILRAAVEAKPKAFAGESFDDKLVNFAHKVVHGLHSHPGRYIHPDSQSRWVAAPGHTPSAYLSSASAGHARWMSAVMNHFPSGMTPAKLFISQFVFNDRVTTVSQLLSENATGVREAFVAAGLNPDTVDDLVGVFAEAFNNASPVIDKHLPQMLWPIEDGYLALTALPSLAVINSIAALRSLVPDETYVRMGSYAIGSGQPQNQSMAAVGTRGNIPVLDCLPPRTTRTANSDLTRRAHSSRLVEKVSVKALQSFTKNMTAWPNAKREAFLTKAARWHVAEALALAINLREAVEVQAVSLDKLPAGNSAILAFVRGEALTDALARELARVVVQAGPASLFERHTSADVLRYSEAVVAEIKALGA